MADNGESEFIIFDKYGDRAEVTVFPVIRQIVIEIYEDDSPPSALSLLPSGARDLGVALQVAAAQALDGDVFDG